MQRGHVRLKSSSGDLGWRLNYVMVMKRYDFRYFWCANNVAVTSLSACMNSSVWAAWYCLTYDLEEGPNIRLQGEARIRR